MCSVPAVIAAFTGQSSTWRVMMPGMWLMAMSVLIMVGGAGEAAPGDLDGPDGAGLWSCSIWQVLLTTGEVMWSPRGAAWSAGMAPTGREGFFIGQFAIKVDWIDWANAPVASGLPALLAPVLPVLLDLLVLVGLLVFVVLGGHVQLFMTFHVLATSKLNHPAGCDCSDEQGKGFHLQPTRIDRFGRLQHLAPVANANVATSHSGAGLFCALPCGFLCPILQELRSASAGVCE